jgi:hypothetical protein
MLSHLKVVEMGHTKQYNWHQNSKYVSILIFNINLTKAILFGDNKERKEVNIIFQVHFLLGEDLEC